MTENHPTDQVDVLRIMVLAYSRALMELAARTGTSSDDALRAVEANTQEFLDKPDIPSGLREEVQRVLQITWREWEKWARLRGS